MDRSSPNHRLLRVGPRHLGFVSAVAAFALVGTVLLGFPQHRVQAQLKSSDGRAPSGFADIVDRVKPAVVSIQVTGGSPKVAQKGAPAPRGKGPELFPELPDDHP